MADWDLIIVGAGAVGAAAARRAGEAGARTLVLDLDTPAHARGSSHGHGRIFRHAYFEHPDYVPLLRHATARFASLEREEGVPLLHRCGVLLLGDAQSTVLRRSLAAARQWRLDVEALAPPALARRFPMFGSRGAEGLRGVLEADAGIVRPERAIAAALAAAQRRGVRVRLGTRVLDLEETGPVVAVHTDGGNFTAERVIVAAGAWAPQLLPRFRQLLRVTRQVQAWVAPVQGHALAGMPCWLLDRGTAAPAIYGLAPDPLGGDTVAAFPKVAFHGSEILVDPDRGASPPGALDLDPLLEVYRGVAPGLAGQIIAASTCLYTMSPDGDFLVGTTGPNSRLHFAAGLSGHGFKLSPTLGDALVERALFGKTEHPIGFLSPGRFPEVG